MYNFSQLGLSVVVTQPHDLPVDIPDTTDQQNWKKQVQKDSSASLKTNYVRVANRLVASAVAQNDVIHSGRVPPKAPPCVTLDKI